MSVYARNRLGDGQHSANVSAATASEFIVWSLCVCLVECLCLLQLPVSS